MDLVWLVIPVAIALFVLRAFVIARKLKSSAQVPMPSDGRTLREAQAGLRAHHDHLGEAIAAPREHLAAAKDLPRAAMGRPRSAKGVDAIVQDFLPERRL